VAGRRLFDDDLQRKFDVHARLAALAHFEIRVGRQAHQVETGSRFLSEDVHFGEDQRGACGQTGDGRFGQAFADAFLLGKGRGKCTHCGSAHNGHAQGKVRHFRRLLGDEKRLIGNEKHLGATGGRQP